MTLPNRPKWRKSSYSASQQECVEVAVAPSVGVRDTKDREGGELVFPAAAWTVFTRRVR
jgi:hypothetical protein